MMRLAIEKSGRKTLPVIVALTVAVMPIRYLSGRELSFEEALDIAVNRSSQGEIIRGNLEVAERNYSATRIKFYVPEVSLQGSVPAWDVREDYTYFQGTSIRGPRKETALDLNSFIGLEQNLITGGKLTLRTYLSRNELELTEFVDLSEDSTEVITSLREELHRGSRFEVVVDQPILKPSEPKNELNNRKDDLEIARLTRIEEIAELKKEVVEAYFGYLQMSVHKQIAADKLESARLQTEIDSVKFADGILSEEELIESTSSGLDAELEQYDIENNFKTRRNELVILLSLDDVDELVLLEPDSAVPISDAEKSRLIAASENSLPILKAQFEYDKAERRAEYEADSRGLSGTLSANYVRRSDNVSVEAGRDRDVDLNSWGINLRFDYPIWDGGASGAVVKAAELQAQQAKIEYERARQSAKAEIENLLNSIDVSYRKLQVLDRQIGLARSRLEIAHRRYSNGEISRITYLESSVELLETSNSYYEELKNYFIDRFELEGKFES